MFKKEYLMLEMMAVNEITIKKFHYLPIKRKEEVLKQFKLAKELFPGVELEMEYYPGTPYQYTEFKHGVLRIQAKPYVAEIAFDTEIERR